MDVALLIQDAYIYANILGENEVANATEVNIGLKLLLSIIRIINISGKNISLLSQDVFTLTPDLETFSIQNYIQLLKIQFLLGGIWFNILDVGLNEYLNNAVIFTADGIPYITFCKRTPTGIDLELFFKPDQAYTLRVFGVKNLDQLALTDQLQGVTLFHQDLLTFSLSKELQIYNQMQPTQFVLNKLAEIKQAMQSIKNTNTDIRLSNIGRSSTMSDVADFNILRGYMPGG